MAGDFESTPAFKVGAVALTVAVVAFVVFTVVNLGQREATARDKQGPVVASSSSADPSADQLDTVFMGDSITESASAGLNTASQSQPWPIQVAIAASSPWLQQTNAAVAGASTGQMLNVALPGVLAAKPQAVVVMVGTVDASRHTKIPRVQAHLQSILTQLQQAGIKIWVISPPPNNNFNTSVANVVSAEKKTSEAMGVPFVDIFHAVGGAGGNWTDDDTIDGTLPDAAGQTAIADAVLAAVGTSSSASASPTASAS